MAAAIPMVATIRFRSGLAQAHALCMLDPALETLLPLAAVQHGCFTAAQARDHGLRRSTLATHLATGEWQRRHPRVFVVCGAGPSWYTDMAAATLARSTARGSHRAGARLHRLDGFAVAPAEITVGAHQDVRLDGVVVHRSIRHRGSATTVVSGIPVTSVAATLCDLGAVVDDDRLERAVDSALRLGLTEAELTATLELLDRPGPSGTAALRRVLARPHRVGAMPETWFERLLDALVHSPLLPPVERQHTVRRDGRVVARFDAAFPVVRVGVEAHSDAWHFGPRRGERDRRRDRALAELGWERVYLSWWEVRDPADAVASLLAICRRRAIELRVDLARWLPLRS